MTKMETLTVKENVGQLANHKYFYVVEFADVVTNNLPDGATKV